MREIISAITILVLASCCFDSRTRSVTGRTGEARSEVWAIHQALALFRIDHGGFPVAMFKAADDTVDYEALCKELSERHDSQSAYLTRPCPLRDLWGNLYQIQLDRDGDGSVRINGKLLSSPIAIWSYGPNGVNEYGEGDDIASWRLGIANR